MRVPATLLALTVAAAGLLLAGAPSGALAQEPLDIRSDSTSLDFPNTLTFHLEATAPVPIERAELRYRVGESACGKVTAAAFPAVSPGAEQSLTWAWDLRERGGLPVGATLTYWWVLSGGGRTFATPERTLIYEDPRFDWRVREGEHVTIGWYRGDESFADGLLAAAEGGIARLQAATGALPAQRVRVRVYASAEAMRGAFVFGPEWAGGVAYAEHSLVSLGVGPGDEAWGVRALVHELSHVVVSQATASCGGELPAWLDEGLAVYNEGPLESEFAQALSEAIAADRVFSVRSLAGAFPYGRADATLAYAQSHALAAYLIETYGAERMDALFAAFRQSGAIDRALNAAYGFDQRGLDAAWRASVGLPPSSAISPPPLPTLEPAATPTPVPTPSSPASPEGAGGGCTRGAAAGRPLDGAAVAGLAALGWLALRRFGS